MKCIVLAFIAALVIEFPALGQQVEIRSLSKAGALTWTQNPPNGLAAIEQATNVAAGPWLPLRSLFVTGAVSTINISNPAIDQARFFRVSASDTSNVPAGMALIPKGYFQMGDSYSETFANALPVHAVLVNSFYMDRFETSNDRLRQVLQWAYDHALVTAGATGVTNSEGQQQLLVNFQGSDSGYPYSHLRFTNDTFIVLSNKGNFPATGITWHGALAYCNYRSDIEGLPRCVNFTNWTCDFEKNGYRLPTEAEWEKAARGGLTGQHFPWDSEGGSYAGFIDGTMANYLSSRSEYYPWTTPIGYFDGRQLYNGVPAGQNMVNGYGLFDMAGNVWEWVWDYYQSDWYSQPAATYPDTRGPDGPWTGTQWLLTQVIRGGSAGYNLGFYLTCACRHSQGFAPIYASAVVGFRAARTF